eukprot:939611_1
MAQQIREPVVKLALSTQARLTLGAVRIHGKKIYYLLSDSSDALFTLTKHGQNVINLPGSEMEAKFDSITLQVVPGNSIDALDPQFGSSQMDNTMLVALPLSDAEADKSSHANVARDEDITLNDMDLLHGLGSDGGLMTLTTGTCGGGTMGDSSTLLTMSQNMADDDLISLHDTLSRHGDDILLMEDLPLVDPLSQDMLQLQDLEIGFPEHELALPMISEEMKEHMDPESQMLEDEEVAVKVSKKRRSKNFLKQSGFDPITELSDDSIRSNLTEVASLVIDRPVLRAKRKKSFKRTMHAPGSFAQKELGSDLSEFFHWNLYGDEYKSSKRRKTGNENMDDANMLPDMDLPLPDMREPASENMILDENKSQTGQSVASVEARRGIARLDEESNISRNSFLGRNLDGDFQAFEKSLKDDASQASRHSAEPLLLPGHKHERSSISTTADGVSLLLPDLARSSIASSVSGMDFTGGSFGTSTVDNMLPIDENAVLNDFDTPDIELPASQFEIPESSAKTTQGADEASMPEVSRMTRVFKSIVEEKIISIEEQMVSEDKNAITITSLEDIWSGVGGVSRHDAALSFLQLLVLKSMAVVNVKQ